MIDLVQPFPADKLWQAWEWFEQTPALMNRTNCKEGDFVKWAQDQRSWGILLNDKLQGIVLFQSVDWPGAAASDGFITYGLARRAWGRKVIEATRESILGDLFKDARLERVTGYTSARNKAAQRLAMRLGCQLEGRVRRVSEDILIYGLTRGDFYGRSNNHHTSNAGH